MYLLINYLKNVNMSILKTSMYYQLFCYGIKIEINYLKIFWYST